MMENLVDDTMHVISKQVEEKPLFGVAYFSDGNTSSVQIYDKNDQPEFLLADMFYGMVDTLSTTHGITLSEAGTLLLHSLTEAMKIHDQENDISALKLPH